MIWYPVQAASCFDEAALMIKHVCGFKIMHRFSYFFDSKAPHYHWNFKSLTRNRLGIFTCRQEKFTLSWKTGFCKEGLFAGQGSKKGVSPHPAHLLLLSLVFLQTLFLITFKRKALDANRID